ncbi:MAG: hypothetical protein ACRDQ4_07225 [Pseudonocardiaceae bacterium]
MIDDTSPTTARYSRGGSAGSRRVGSRCSPHGLGAVVAPPQRPDPAFYGLMAGIRLAARNRYGPADGSTFSTGGQPES